MIATCPHCQKKLKLSAKIEENLRLLSPEKSLRISCPQCGGAILLDANMLAAETAMTPAASPPPRPAGRQVTPPPPPDHSGLDATSPADDEAKIEDVPQILILMPESPDLHLIAEAMETFGYQPSIVLSAEEAIEKMQFVSYASVILHSRFEGSDFENGPFHQFMGAMHMNKRRYIFYILTGPEFHTLYDLQALAYSANLVVNDKDLPQLPLILRKTIPQYEAMFGAIMQEMNALDRESRAIKKN